MLRIVLFLATNVAVMIAASIAIAVLTATGIIPPGAVSAQHFVFAAVFGMGGSFLSLAISKWMAKRAMRVQVIEAPSNETERWLVQTVHAQAEQAGIGKPEVGVFDSPDPNAFATGMSKNNALVAVSTGLLHVMDKDEVEAVLGHEVGHVANGDMVTLALIQGVVNTFVIFFARIIADRFDKGRFLIYIALQMAFGFLASMVVAWFSRRREFRADEQGARLKSAPAMAAALGKLQSLQGVPPQMPDNMAAFGIRGGGMMKLLSTHPPLEERIARLR